MKKPKNTAKLRQTCTLVQKIVATRAENCHFIQQLTIDRFR